MRTLRTLGQSMSLARQFSKNTGNHCSLGANGTVPHLDQATGISFFCWCRYFSVDSGGGQNNLLRTWMGMSSSAGFAISLRDPASSGVRLEYNGRSDAADSSVVNVSSDQAVAAGEWMAVGCVANYASGRIRLFRDGARLTDAAGTNWSLGHYNPAGDSITHDGLGVFFSSGTTTIASTSRQLDGDMAHVALWNVALSDVEMMLLGRGQHPLTIKPEHQLYFSLDGSHGSREPDRTGRLVGEITGDLPIVPGPWQVRTLFDIPAARNRLSAYRYRPVRTGVPVAVYQRLLADSLGFGVGSQFSTIRQRLQQDSLGLVDETALSTLVARLVADLLGLADVRQSRRVAHRIVTALLGMDDDEAAITISWRAIVDGLGVADQAAASGPVLNIHTAVVQVVLGMVDAVSRQQVAINSRVLVDALAIAEAVSSRMSIQRLATDAIGTDDAFARVTFIHRAYAEALQLATASHRLAHAHRLLVDRLSLVDGLSGGAIRALPWVVVLSETIGFGDRFASSSAYLRRVFDDLGLADDYRALSMLLRSVADVLGVPDEVAYARLCERLLAEGLGGLDKTRRASISRREVMDLLSLTDAADLVMSVLRVAVDVLGTGDDTHRTAEALRMIVDLLATGDALGQQRSAGVAISDGLGLADDSSQQVAYRRLAVSALGFWDAIANLAPSLVRLALVVDHLGLADAMAREATVLRRATEAIALIDDAQYGMDRSLSLVETLAFGEIVPRKVEYYRALEDVLALATSILDSHRSEPLRSEVVVEAMDLFRGGAEAWQVAAEV